MKFLNNMHTKNVLKILVVLVLMLVVYMVWKELVSKKNINSIKFNEEYTKLSDDNLYKYATKTEILKAFNQEKAVVLFGFPTCKWCQEYVVHLNDIAKEYGVSEILYYNIKEDRANNTAFYKKIVKKLEEHLLKDEEGKPRIYVPDVYFIKDGNIIGHNNDTSTIDNTQIEDYYTEENVVKLHEELKKLFRNTFNCDDINGC